MNSVRLGLSIVTILLLSLGYAVSQYEQFSGNVSAYVAKADQPPVRMAATLLLLLAVVLGLWRENGAAEK